MLAPPPKDHIPNPAGANPPPKTKVYQSPTQAGFFALLTPELMNTKGPAGPLAISTDAQEDPSRISFRYLAGGIPRIRVNIVVKLLGLP